MANLNAYLYITSKKKKKKKKVVLENEKEYRI